MELRQIRYFIAVAETLNFSRAAETLYISQSALSQQVADLEREMGTELLLRSKRSVELTAAGETLLREGKKLLLRSEKLTPMVRHSAQSTGGVTELYLGLDLRVVGSPVFLSMLTDAVYLLHREQPGLRPVYQTFEFPELARSLDIGELDMGFFLHHEQSICANADIRTRILAQEEMVLVVRAEEALSDTPETVRDILQTRGLILLDKETKGMSQALRILEALGIEAPIRFCANREVMTLAARSGEAAIVLPQSVAARFTNTGLQTLHFRAPCAGLFLLAAWRCSNANPLIPVLLDALSS